MALQSFTWNNGTNDNPVSLNAQQLSNLVRLATNENITKDVRGHITTTSGTISRYDKYVLNQAFQNLVVHATEQEDSFSLFASRTTINEGETSTIIVTGMATSSVDFALEHTVTGRNGIEENAVKAKMHMDGNILVVDAPQENASWQDVVRVKAKPIYEDWSNSSAIRYVDITVKAVALFGVSLIGNSTIPVGNSEEISVNLTPSNCTKSSGVSFSNTLISDGSLPVMQPTVINDKIFITAPAEECVLTLTTNVHLFGDENSIAFYTTKQFTVAIPRLIIEVTTDGTFSDIGNNPKNVIVKRTVSTDGTAISSEDQNLPSNKFTLLGSEAVVANNKVTYSMEVVANGVETFVVSFDEILEYKPISDVTITPNTVNNVIQVVYQFKRPDLYFVYGDGDYEPLSAIETRGSFKSGKTRIGIAIVTEETSFIISVKSEDSPQNGTFSNDRLIYSGTNIVDSAFKSTVLLDAKEDFNGQQNTAATYNAWQETRASNNIVGRFFDVAERTTQINGITYNGFIPALGQLELIVQNAQTINSFINTYLGTSDYLYHLLISDGHYYYASSSKYSDKEWWGYDGYSNQNPHETKKDKNTTGFKTVICYPFNL